MNIFPWVWRVLLLLFGAGCASAPPLAPLEISGLPIPVAWGDSLVSDGAIEDGWWADFGVVALDSLVVEALQNNHDLAAAEARIRGAAAHARIAGADRLPRVGVGAGASRAQRNFIGLPDFGGPVAGLPGQDAAPGVLSTTSTTLGVSLDLTWELDLWGRVRSAVSGAWADHQAMRADLWAARESVAGQVSKAYFAVVEAALQQELAAATVENRREFSRRIEERYGRGLTPALDVYSARSDLAAAKAVLQEHRIRGGAVRRQLELLLGRYPQGELEAVDGLPAPPLPPPAGLPADLIARRPDLVAAERRLAAARARHDEARKNYYPRLSLTGSTGSSSEALEGLADGDHLVWSFGATLSQPIYQGGAIRAGAEVAEAQWGQAWTAFVQAALVAYSDVEGALEAEAFLRHQEVAIGEIAQAAQGARELAERRYHRGIGGGLRLLDSQRNECDARSRWLDVRRRRLETRVNLYLALGGGFERAALEGESVPLTRKRPPA